MDWKNHLIMCPSQCEADTETANVTLYMRWRHRDPWSFAVVRDIDGLSGGTWCYICGAPEFTHDDYEEAQKWFERFWEQKRNVLLKKLNEDESIYAAGN